MDDEQGPWWTRPPEPGPQAPPVPRRRPNGPHGVEVEDPPAEAAYADTTVIYPPIERAPEDYPRPRLVEPEPEPEPPARPVVRRVAVVPPTPPPVRTAGRDPRDAQTENLPPASDGIFATFSGPGSGQGAAAPGRAVTDHPPAPDRRAAGDPSDQSPAGPLAGPLAFFSQVKQVNLPEPRVLLLGAAGALVVLLIVVVALVSGRGPDANQAANTSKPSSSPAAGEIVLKGKSPSGLKQLGAVDATAQLSKLGQGPGGTIVEAWSWTDKNGRNLVVTSIAPARSNKRTLRVIHVAGLEGNKPRTLRVMRDPNLPANCNGAGQAGFTPKSLIVRDLNGDNVAEVVSGWSSRCGGKAVASQIKLALITDGDKYILRGQGVIGEAGTFTPSPRAAQWPDKYLTMLGEQYRKLYR